MRREAERAGYSTDTAGTDVTTSALLRHGPDLLARIEAEFVAWMVEDEYQSVDQLRGYLRAPTSYPLTEVWSS